MKQAQFILRALLTPVVIAASLVWATANVLLLPILALADIVIRQGEGIRELPGYIYDVLTEPTLTLWGKDI